LFPPWVTEKREIKDSSTLVFYELPCASQLPGKGLVQQCLLSRRQDRNQPFRARRPGERRSCGNSVKNAIWGPFGNPGELKTPFAGHLNLREGQKRRLQVIGNSWGAENAVLGPLGNPGGPKTPFAGHLEIRQSEKRRLGGIWKFGRTKNAVFAARFWGERD
jgi:hypothetical protein